MAKVYDNATDLITFSRNSTGTALRRVGYGDELITTTAVEHGNWTVSGTTVTATGTASSTDNVVFTLSEALEAGKVYQILIPNNMPVNGFYVGSVGAGLANVGALDAADDYVIVKCTAPTSSLRVGRWVGSPSGTIGPISVKEVIFDRPTDDLVLFNHPNDIPRIEYAADGSLKGLLIEEDRSNFIQYSEDFSHSSWAKTNTTIDGTLTSSPDGQTNGHTAVFTGGGSLLRTIGSSCSVGETYTASIWAKAGASNSVNLSVLFSGGGLGMTTETLTLTSEWQRFSVTSTVPAGTPDFARLRLTSTEAGNIELYGAQIEQGSFVTSYIPTSNGQSTRNPDIASIQVSAFGYNENAGTWYMEWDTADTDNTFSKYVLSSGNDARVMYNNTGSTAWYAFDGSTASTYTQPTGITLDGSSIKATYAEDDNGASVAHTGFLGTGSASPDLLPNYNPIYGWSIGNLNGNNYFLNGHIKSLSYYPRRLTDAQLQELTS